MRPFKFFIALLLLTACVDAPVVPGALNARWTLSPNSCETLHLVAIRAQVRLQTFSDESLVTGDEVIAEMTVPCKDDGEILLDALDPGKYALVIEGFNGDEEPRATYIASQEGINVLEGETTSSDALRLVEKYGRIHVRWAFEAPLQCVDVGADQISVQVIDSSNREVAMSKVPCNHTFIDAEDGKEKSGLMLEEIKAASDLVVLVDVYDESGEVIQSGEAKGFILLPGETEPLTIALCESAPCE